MYRIASQQEKLKAQKMVRPSFLHTARSTYSLVKSQYSVQAASALQLKGPFGDIPYVTLNDRNLMPMLGTYIHTYIHACTHTCIIHRLNNINYTRFWYHYYYYYYYYYYYSNHNMYADVVINFTQLTN